MKLPSWLKGAWTAIAAAAVIALALFAKQRIKTARRAADTATRRAEFIEDNTDRLDTAQRRSAVHHAKARVYSAKADAIRTATVAKLKQVEESRGSKTASTLADQLNSL